MDMMEIQKRLDEIDKNLRFLTNLFQERPSFHPDERKVMNNLREDIDVIKNELRI